MTTHPIQTGTWIRSKVPVGDCGDYGEREAPAGALGRIDADYTNAEGPYYSVVFWPSFISNFWDAAEIDADAEILPAGHPDIPDALSYDLASAVADIVADGDVGDAAVEAPGAVVARIRAAASTAGGRAGEILALIADGDEEEGITMDFASFDRLAAIVGVGDRLTAEAPANEPA